MTLVKPFRRKHKPATRVRVDKADHLAQQILAFSDNLLVRSFVREHVFHPTRKWRFDLAWPTHKLAVEVDGFGPRGSAGRHQRVAGFTEDCVKGNEAIVHGWRVLHVTPKQINTCEAMNWIERALGQ